MIEKTKGLPWEKVGQGGKIMARAENMGVSLPEPQENAQLLLGRQVGEERAGCGRGVGASESEANSHGPLAGASQSLGGFFNCLRSPPESPGFESLVPAVRRPAVLLAPPRLPRVPALDPWLPGPWRPKPASLTERHQEAPHARSGPGTRQAGFARRRDLTLRTPPRPAAPAPSWGARAAQSLAPFLSRNP